MERKTNKSTVYLNVYLINGSENYILNSCRNITNIRLGKMYKAMHRNDAAVRESWILIFHCSVRLIASVMNCMKLIQSMFMFSPSLCPWKFIKKNAFPVKAECQFLISCCVEIQEISYARCKWLIICLSFGRTQWTSW